MLDTTRTQSLSEPAAVVAALWIQAWLSGQSGADDLLSVLAEIAPDTPAGLHRDGRTLPAAELLARLRTAEVTHTWPVLPRPGRTAGWPTHLHEPPCPAVLLVRSAGGSDQLPMGEVGLLRAASGGWVVDDLVASSVPGAPVEGSRLLAGPVGEITARSLSPRAATRRFAELIEAAAADLGRLGLDRAPRDGSRPRWSDALGHVPVTVDPHLDELLQRCGVVLDAVDRALLDDGAAVTAGEVRARSSRLHLLDAELVELIPAAVAGATLNGAGPRP